MAYLVVKKHGIPVLAIEGGTAEEGPTHLANGYPHLLASYAVGYITFTEQEAAPTLGPMDYVASMDAYLARIAGYTSGVIVRLLYDLERRVRALELVGTASWPASRRKALLSGTGDYLCVSQGGIWGS